MFSPDSSSPGRERSTWSGGGVFPVADALLRPQVSAGLGAASRGPSRQVAGMRGWAGCGSSPRRGARRKSSTELTGGGFATEYAGGTSPRPRGVGVRGIRNGIRAGSVASPPQSGRAGDLRQTADRKRRRPPAQALRGGPATFYGANLSQIPRTPAPRGQHDKVGITPCSAGRPPRRRRCRG